VSRIVAPLGVGQAVKHAEASLQGLPTTNAVPATQVTISAELRASLVRALLEVEQAAPPVSPKLQGR
jgi:hypothetical protein